MQSTLLLAASYEPIDVISWKDAIRLMTLGKAEIIEEYDKDIRSMYLVIKMPAVVRLVNSFRKRKAKVKFSRVNIYTRDKYTCFGAGTRVLMADGSQQDIEFVVPGDKVIDAFGKVTEVVHTGGRIVENACLLSHRGSFEKTVVTKEHPYLTNNGKFVPIGENPEYLVFPRKVDYTLDAPTSIEVGKYLPTDKWFRFKNGRIYNTRRGHEHGFPSHLQQSRELSYIAGLYVGDGSSVMPTGRVSWAFNVGQKSTYVEDVRKYVEGLGLHVGCSESNKGKGFVVGTSNKVLAYMLRSLCGYGGSDKKITPWDIIGPYHADYLRGLFCADGYMAPKLRKVVLNMTSFEVIQSAQSMLWGAGIFPTLQHIAREGKKETLSLFLQGENYSKFMQVIMGEDVECGKPVFGDTSFVYRKMQELEVITHNNVVYNIETVSHSYIANGLSVHNCQYCGVKGSMKIFTFDHVLPRSRGGKTCWQNITTCCRDCNSKKRDRTPEEAGMKLIKRPERPKWLPSVTIRLSKQPVPGQWNDYLYWHSSLIEE